MYAVWGDKQVRSHMSAYPSKSILSYQPASLSSAAARRFCSASRFSCQLRKEKETGKRVGTWGCAGCGREWTGKRVGTGRSGGIGRGGWGEVGGGAGRCGWVQWVQWVGGWAGRKRWQRLTWSPV